MKKKIFIAMVGLVGSGKSVVAQELARKLYATIIRGDALRLELSRKGKSYAKIDDVFIARVHQEIKRNNILILDSDYVRSEKRKLLAREARTLGAHLVYVRTVADVDDMLGRMMQGSYTSGSERIFLAARSSWKGAGKGGVVKIREAIRRMPHHYQWTNEGGGKWALRMMSFPLIATIDTTDGKTWKKKVATLSKRLS